MEMDKAIEQAQKKIEYITNDAESYRQILLREQALMDYQSDLNAYKQEGRQEGRREGRREGRQETIDAMRSIGVSEEKIKEAMQKLSES